MGHPSIQSPPIGRPRPAPRGPHLLPHQHPPMVPDPQASGSRSHRPKATQVPNRAIRHSKPNRDHLTVPSHTSGPCRCPNSTPNTLKNSINPPLNTLKYRLRPLPPRDKPQTLPPLPSEPHQVTYLISGLPKGLTSFASRSQRICPFGDSPEAI